MNQAMDDRGWSDPGQDPAPTPIIVPQPAGSPIVVERHADGLTIRVPAAGVWRGTKGMFLFSLMWIGLVTIITVALSVAFVFFPGPKGEEVWIAPLILLTLWAVGIGLLIASIHMGSRHAALAVAGGQLMVIQSGIFGTKERSWAIADVSAIRVGESGMTVNDVPVMQLQIFDRLRKKTGLLTGRPDEELEWLASELRAAVGLVE